jgi:uncharacterized protein
MSSKGSFSKLDTVETVIAVRVIPNSGVNEVSELLDDGCIKIRLTAPPSGGKANEALIKYLAKILSIRKKQIKIKRGFTSRNKLISIQGVDRDAIYREIIESIESAHK